MFDRYYRPSKRVSAVGMIGLIVAYIALGAALAWVYLWINRKCTIVMLNVFAALGYGALMGFVGKMIVKKFKLRNPTMVLVALIIGILGMTYVKWAMYVHYDWQMIAEQYEEADTFESIKDDMKSTNAYEAFEMYYDFEDEEGVPYDFEEAWNILQTNAYTYMNVLCLTSDVDINEQFSSAQIAEMKDCNLYEWYYYDVILGETKEECKTNVEKARAMNAADYIENVRGLDLEDFVADYYGTIEVPSLGKVLAHPGDLWERIKEINEVGRWSYSSSSSSYSSTASNSEPITGVMLWIVWIAELFVINSFALAIAYSQSKEIFIEQDNDWAQTYDGNRLTFNPMNGNQLKSMLEMSGDNVTNLMPVAASSLNGRPYLKLTFSHAKDFSEVYLNAFSMTYNHKNRNYVSSKIFKGMKITPKQAGILMSMFNIPAQGKIASDPEFIDWQRSGGAPMGGGYQQTSAAPQQTAAPMQEAVETCGSCGTQIPAGKKFCPNCGAPVERSASSELDGAIDKQSFEAWKNAKNGNSSSDEMDSISTDDIDTTDF